MKNFIHHNIPSLVQINEAGSRVYQTPTGEKYPSVTTVVGFHTAKDIHAWRKRVGNDEANKVSARASKRGSNVHFLCENYLLGTPKEPDMFDKSMFDTMIPHLDRINNIHCLETRLFSHKLKTAGTVDCIAEYDGKICIIDFKSSLKAKKKEWITNYFMQCAAYGMMFWELTGIPIKDILIIMGVDNEEALVFQEPIIPWLCKFREVRAQYFLAKGI